ncbi:MAG: hypothetical protein US39_C0005G0022 [Microgenomates group bacterium GW2011_GWC1_37_12b]|nr:MAG: hypothetical protein US39_C0005G0022 [Microgenomates group bacterium GW2011_GWC1_37_12b]
MIVHKIMAKVNGGIEVDYSTLSSDVLKVHLAKNIWERRVARRIRGKGKRQILDSLAEKREFINKALTKQSGADEVV